MSDHFEFLQANHPKLKSKRGEWRLPDAPVLISEEFYPSGAQFFDGDDFSLNRFAKYDGIPDDLVVVSRVSKKYLKKEHVMRAVRDFSGRRGEQKARVRLFSGPRPRLRGKSRKAKREHREALRLYKWKTKWAKRQMQ